MGLRAYDLERLTAGGTKVSHHAGYVKTDGPWLILGDASGEPDAFELIVAAHAVVSLEPCQGRCRDGRE